MNVTILQARSFLERLEEIAVDVARLGRRVAGDEYAEYLIARVGSRIDGLDAFLQLSAGELVQLGYQANAALAHVDAQARHVRALLGEKAA